MQVARQVRDLNPPGRFLSIKGGGHTPRPDTCYQVLDSNQALEKIASTISNLKMEPTAYHPAKVQAKVHVKMEKVVAPAVASVQKKTKSKNTGGRKPANSQEAQKEKPRFSVVSTKLQGTKAAAKKMKAQEPSPARPLLRLRKTDVILLVGRGAATNASHGGNIRLAQFCSKNFRAYRRASTRRYVPVSHHCCVFLRIFLLLSAHSQKMTTIHFRFFPFFSRPIVTSKLSSPRLSNLSRTQHHLVDS